MKYLLVLVLLITPLLTYAQEKVFLKNNKHKAIEYDISQNTLYVKFVTEKKDRKEAKMNDFKFISENDALVTLNTKGLTFKENAKNVKAKINENDVTIFPVLIHKDGSKIVCTNEILVKFKSNYSLDKLFPSYKYTVIPNEFNQNLYLLKLENTDTFQVLDLINQVENHPEIEYIVPNYLRFAQLATNDTYYSSQWSIDNQGYLGGTPDADMDVDAAWKIATDKGYGIKVAVLGVGVDLSHDDLDINMLRGSGADFAPGRPSKNGAPEFGNAHETACAGIIAAFGGNGRGVAGIAYYSNIIPIRIGYDINNDGSLITSDKGVADGIRHAIAEGANVLSNSWLMGGLATSTIVDAIDEAEQAGCITLFSSGNFETGDSHPENEVPYPANLENVIAVGASSMCDERKTPSSCDGENWASIYGQELDVIAPGVKIYTTDLSGTFEGYNTNPFDSDNGDYTSTFNGTSAACPNVAGVVALMLSVNPNLNQEEVREILAKTADKPSAYTYSNNEHGDWNEEVGYGRVNANRAVLAALDVHIEGSDAICGRRPLIFRLKNLPKNTDVNVVWTHSSNIMTAYDPAQGEHGFAAVAIGSGQGWVQADINGAIFRKEIAWVGTADIELDRVSNSNYVTVNLVGANGTDINDQGITSVVWEVLSDDKGQCPASFYANGFTGHGNGNCFNWLVELKITVTNGCGTAVFYENVSPRAVDPCDDPKGRIRFSQNPMKEGAGTNKIIIDPCAGGNGKGVGSERYTVSVHTSHGEQVYSKTQTGTDFDISHLKKGFYIARFTTKSGQALSKQFIIE